MFINVGARHNIASNWQGSFWETLVLCCLKLVKEAEQSFLRTDDSQSANFSCLICHLCVWDCSFRESSRAEAGSRSRVYSEVMQSLNVNKVWRWQKYPKGFMAHQSWTKGNWKNLAWFEEVRFLIDIRHQIVGSEFGTNNMKSCFHPGLCQRLSLVV